VCAIDRHTPRDGRVLEELGTYDTSVANTDARAILKKDRIDYWLSVGAQPSDKVGVLIKKYGSRGTHLEKQQQALHKLAEPKQIADPGPPVSLPKEAEEPKAKKAQAQQTPTEPPPQDEAAKSPDQASTPPKEEAGGDEAPSE
jgi:small subunit ribosomal protein S16